MAVDPDITNNVGGKDHTEKTKLEQEMVSASNPESTMVIRILHVLVGLDMLAVSLVVPLLQTYYKNAGVSSAKQREFLSSAFSISQIVGGLAIGAAGDAGLISEKNIVLLSFVGSFISYGMIGFLGDSIYAIIISRLIVGSVKQTMTVTTAMLTKRTSAKNRAGYMGTLTACSTISWVIGPSLGGLLYKNFSESTPALVACALFVVNSIVAFVYLPNQQQVHKIQSKVSTPAPSKLGKNKPPKFNSFISNLKACFSSRKLGSAITCMLLHTWFFRATSYASLGSFYEDKYGIETYQRGYLSSYQTILLFIVQSKFVRPLLEALGGECVSAVWGAFGLTLATLIETKASLPVFILVVSPIVAISVPLLGLSLKSLVTKASPKETIGSVLAVLDVLQNAAAVTVPFYRTMLFMILDWLTHCVSMNDILRIEECKHLMKGDPLPDMWILSSAFHWFLLTLLIRILCHDNFQGTKNVNKIKTS